MHRVAISDKRIVSCNAQEVTFRYTPTGKKQSVTRSVKGTEFVRGVVQHTLTTGFQKVRYYGWMSPNCAIDLDEVGPIGLLLGCLAKTHRLGKRRAAVPGQRVEDERDPHLNR